MNRKKSQVCKLFSYDLTIHVFLVNLMCLIEAIKRCLSNQRIEVTSNASDNLNETIISLICEYTRDSDTFTMPVIDDAIALYLDESQIALNECPLTLSFLHWIDHVTKHELFNNIRCATIKSAIMAGISTFGIDRFGRNHWFHLKYDSPPRGLVEPMIVLDFQDKACVSLAIVCALNESYQNVFVFGCCMCCVL